MTRINSMLDFSVANTWISLHEIVAEIAYEPDSAKRIELLKKFDYIDRLLRLKIHAQNLGWEEFSFERMHEETGNLCAADYWRFEELWDIPLPDLFKRHEEKRREEIEKRRKGGEHW